MLDRLVTHRLVRTDRVGRWQLRGSTHTNGTRLGRAARTLEVLGLLAGRGRRYAIERTAWAWWADEPARRASAGSSENRTPRAPASSSSSPPPVSAPAITMAGHPVDQWGRDDYAAALLHLAHARVGRRRAS